MEVRGYSPVTYSGLVTELDRYLPAARAGCRDALGRLLLCCEAALRAWAQRQVGPELASKLDAGDLVQMTYLQAIRGFSGFRGQNGHELLAWLRGILTRQVVDGRRFLHRQKRDRGREVAWDDRRVAPALIRWDARHKRESAAEALAGSLDRTIACLPGHYRVVLRLRARPLSWAKVGAELDRSPDAARLLFFRAIQALRRALDPPRRPGR